MLVSGWWEGIPDAGGSVGILTMAAVGLMTALNPCMLAMAPAAAGYVGAQNGSRQATLVLAVCFVTGFATTLALLGLGVAAVGPLLGIPVGVWSSLLGPFYVALGLYLLMRRAWRTRWRVPWRVAGFYYRARRPRRGKRGAAPGALALGALFGLTPSPCTYPVVLAVMGAAAQAGEPLRGAALLMAFGLGHSLPLFLGGASAGLARRLSRHPVWPRLFHTVLGVALVALGVVMMAGGVSGGGSSTPHRH